MILKRILAVISAAAISTAVIRFGTVTASATTEGTPISTPQELMDMRPDGNYYLACDIDMLDVKWKSVSDFSGHFNGNGYTISSLYSETYGLFSTLKSGAVVENVTLSDVYIASKNKKVGAVASVIKSSEKNIKIDNCFVSGVVASCRTKFGRETRSTAGSIVGMNNSSSAVISNCYSNAVTAAERTAGGIVGTNRGTVKNCGFGGEIVNSYNVFELVTNDGIKNDDWAYLYASGGIAGFNYGTISDCFSSSERIDAAMYYGGIAGVLQNGGSITRCVNSSEILYDDATGGLIAGYAAKKSTVSNCYSKKPTDSNVQNDIGKGKSGTVTYAVSSDKYGKISSFKRLGDGWVIHGGEPVPKSIKKFISNQPKYKQVYKVKGESLVSASDDDSNKPDEPDEPEKEASVDYGYDEFGDILE